MSSNIDYSSPGAQFNFDVNNSPAFKKNAQNFINILSVDQLNTLKNVSLLDIFLSEGNVIEPHYHQQAAELIFCVSGACTVSFLNPFTKLIQDFPLTPGEVANVPQGWWHYIVATENNTHFIGIFDAPTPDVILGSDLLKLTPTNIMAYTYGMDKDLWKQAMAPVKPATFIGPPTDNNTANEHISYQEPGYADQYSDQLHPYTYQYLPHSEI